MSKLSVMILSATLLSAVPAFAQNTSGSTPFYEMRIYQAPEGKLDDLNARFRNHTIKLFEKHGMTNLGYWVPLDNPDHKLYYVLSYPDREAREKSWKAFMADPDWQAAHRASEVNGRLVEKVESIFLSPTAYSPTIQPSAGDPARTFELRTYKAAPGKLDALHNRFRDHTIALFSRHGMTHLGYWVPVEEKDGAGQTLIYILAHKSPEAAKASFAGFRTDPDWIAAKQASERDGSLTEKVDSLLMKPTDYSPTR
jgi:hypothetical protein